MEIFCSILRVFGHNKVLKNITELKDVVHFFVLQEGKKYKLWPSLLQEALWEYNAKQILQTNKHRRLSLRQR